jgi:CelD/BcsL family acetyltransferase involved in cellulose biosynthesis
VTVYVLDPLNDPRWTDLVERHPSSSVFHTRAWAEALRRTYAYEPVVYTTSAPASTLMNGVPLCRVGNWLTGRRIVSLPYSDHCEPLVDSVKDRHEIVTAVRAAAETEQRQLELRPLTSDCWESEGLVPAESFYFHRLELNLPIEKIFDRTHKSTIQRKIARARKEKLLCESGSSDDLLSAFYRLLVMTRRRHGLPPQPLEWFKNLVRCFGERLTIRVAFKDGLPIGSILTLQHRETIVYKYGCSDASHHSSGVMPFLFWEAIESAKKSGLETLDLGRSDSDNAGLIAFKARWGAVPSILTYLRSSPLRAGLSKRRLLRLPKSLIACVPDRVLTTAGRLLYRYLG